MKKPGLRLSFSSPLRLSMNRSAPATGLLRRRTPYSAQCSVFRGTSGYRAFGSLARRAPLTSARRISFSMPPSKPKSTRTSTRTAPFSTTVPRSAVTLAELREIRRCDSHTSTYRYPLPQLPFRFETGVGLFAKRKPRPFPPPFFLPPSTSFSDPLTTLEADPRRKEMVNGEVIGGCTNGDDAVYASEYFIAANDGVGAWTSRERGHAGLWSRLIVHFWANAVNDSVVDGSIVAPEPVQYLQQAFEQTLEATRPPNDWLGTTTAAGAFISYRPVEPTKLGLSEEHEPVLYVTNLGDSQVMVVRPAERRLVFKTTEQCHWFDCPRQLGTNSPDTPRTDAVVDVVPIRVGDVVLAMSDGVIDNLWSHEIVDLVSKSVAAWQGKEHTDAELCRGMMTAVAEELCEAARVVAVDPFAESPYMENSVNEGLPCEGGKFDDISVVAAVCRRKEVLQA